MCVVFRLRDSSPSFVHLLSDGRLLVHRTAIRRLSVALLVRPKNAESRRQCHSIFKGNVSCPSCLDGTVTAPNHSSVGSTTLDPTRDSPRLPPLFLRHYSKRCVLISSYASAPTLPRLHYSSSASPAAAAAIVVVVVAAVAAAAAAFTLTPCPA